MRRAITCVYCEPKSRMRILECFGGAAVFTLRMSLRHAMFTGGIARLALLRSDCALTRDAASKLVLHLRTFRRCSSGSAQPPTISATAHKIDMGFICLF